MQRQQQHFLANVSITNYTVVSRSSCDTRCNDQYLIGTIIARVIMPITVLTCFFSCMEFSSIGVQLPVPLTIDKIFITLSSRKMYASKLQENCLKLSSPNISPLLLSWVILICQLIFLFLHCDVFGLGCIKDQIDISTILLSHDICTRNKARFFNWVDIL